MGKKETKIILDQSDDQCMVELEPLNPDEVCLYVLKGRVSTANSKGDVNSYKPFETCPKNVVGRPTSRTLYAVMKKIRELKGFDQQNSL